MSTTRYYNMSQRPNPFHELERFFEAMSRQFDESTHHWDIESPLARWSHTYEGMAMDMIDNEDELVVTMDIPGYDRDEIEITVLDHRLRIAADHEETTEIDEESYLRHERSHETMHRTIELPENVDPDGVSASLRNGVLTVTLPKRMGEEARTVEIK